MKEVYLYFRTQATIGNDDAADDSARFPISRLTGMHPTADDTLAIHFLPQIRNNGDGQADDFTNNDKVIVTLSSNNTHKDVITKLSRLFAGAANGGIHQDGFIDVADDLTSTYAVTGIAGLSTISIGAAFA